MIKQLSYSNYAIQYVVSNNMKMITLLISLFCVSTIKAQVNNLKAEYETFKRQTLQEYNDYRSLVNEEYANFVKKTWEEYRRSKAVPLPKEEELPPIFINEDEKNKEKEDKSVVIEEVINTPIPTPQPLPISPIEEQIEPIKQIFNFILYGTNLSVRLFDEHKFQLQNLRLETIAKQWEKLASVKYNNVIKDCLDVRNKYNLCDWAYLRMLDEMCSSFLGKHSNEAELLKAYIYCQSGYQMRLAMANNHLYMLYASQHFIFDKSYWEVDGVYYYADNCSADQIHICKASFPQEKALSLYIHNEQKVSYKQTENRTIQSSDTDWLKFTVSENQNLLDFCSNYPISCIGENFMTRWVMYANMPLSNHAKKQFYPQFKSIFNEIKSTLAQEGVNEIYQLSACVEALCHWIQTGFEYEYDDNVWGKDRAFFADETLYYPYCDCEDRSILFTRLVRDLLGLDCALVYYPGHLATAVALGEEIKGDYLRINGTKYLICDPTYIGAPIGMTMPEMNNKSAKVILLD